MTRLQALATALSEVSAALQPVIAAGGLLGYASGKWLQLLASENYATDFYPATNTVGATTVMRRVFDWIENNEPEVFTNIAP